MINVSNEEMSEEVMFTPAMWRRQTQEEMKVYLWSPVAHLMALVTGQRDEIVEEGTTQPSFVTCKSIDRAFFMDDCKDKNAHQI